MIYIKLIHSLGRIIIPLTLKQLPIQRDLSLIRLSISLLEIMVMENDLEIIEQVDKLAKSYNVSMSEIALAWLFKKGVHRRLLGRLILNILKKSLRPSI